MDVLVNAAIKCVLFGSERLLIELADYCVYISLCTFLHFSLLMAKSRMEREALFSLMLWLIMAFQPLRLICANMEGGLSFKFCLYLIFIYFLEFLCYFMLVMVFLGDGHVQCKIIYSESRIFCLRLGKRTWS